MAVQDLLVLVPPIARDIAVSQIEIYSRERAGYGLALSR